MGEEGRGGERRGEEGRGGERRGEEGRGGERRGRGVERRGEDARGRERRGEEWRGGERRREEGTGGERRGEDRQTDRQFYFNTGSLQLQRIGFQESRAKKYNYKTTVNYTITKFNNYRIEKMLQ